MSATGVQSAAETATRDPLLRARFDDLPAGMIVRAFGVDYAHLRPRQGGDLYVTRLGWRHAAGLDPACWYAERQYAQRGVRLPGSGGHAYHFETRLADGRPSGLVIKFSRMAQDVPVVIETSFPEAVPEEVLAQARFNSPLEEFGLVMELRQGAYGPRDLRIRTQRPLAIYVPPEEFDLWELGRSTSSFQVHRSLLAEEQDPGVKAIELDIRRIYVLLYGWIDGLDAEACFDAGDLSSEEFHALTPRVMRELGGKGFHVLDTKPKHFILRHRRRDGRILRRGGGELVYGLVDFELLQRTPGHQRLVTVARREAYWHLQSRPPQLETPAVPSHLLPVSIFGVDYIFGVAPDGGRVWVVGREPALFDYFLPDRWRRTPRVKLSAGNEVYRTRTRDHIDVVYRRSRVGLRPRVDPLAAAGKRIREAGYNSPFEEVAIAERLRQMGIPTTYPRAVYRTGHESLKAARLRDPRRIADHADVRTPGAEPGPVLAAQYDYYVIWDTYRGLDPLREAGPGAIGGVVGLDRARDDGLVTPQEMAEILERTRARLQCTGLPVEDIADDEFVVRVEAGGVARRDGEVEVVLGLDALTAYDYGLLGEEPYLALMARMDERLRAVDCEKLDPNGHHRLLPMDPDGRFEKDASGDFHVTLCNFALIRGLYRPIR